MPIDDVIRDNQWFFNPQFMDFVDEVKLRHKGDEMSKRTEISYRNIKNVNPRGEPAVEFVGFKNVMTLSEIDKEISKLNRIDSYAQGRCYYQIFGGICIWNKKEKIDRIYSIGENFAPSDWHFFIDFLLEAGERYGEIKADLKASEVQTITI